MRKMWGAVASSVISWWKISAVLCYQRMWSKPHGSLCHSDYTNDMIRPAALVSHIIAFRSHCKRPYLRPAKQKENKFPRPTNHRWARLFLFQIYGCQHVGQCWTSFRTWTWSRPTNDQMILPITLHKCSKWQSSWTWRHVLYLKECSQCTVRYPFNPHKCRSLQDDHLKKKMNCQCQPRR